MARTTFYFDLGSPYAYLTAERLGEALGGGAAAWQPISLGGLFKANGRSSWALRDPATRAEGIEEVERRARAYGLPELRWPDPWPGNYLFAMRVATFAFQVGRGEEFTVRALRDAFQHGRDLGTAEQVLQSAEQAGLDPRAARAATADPQVKQALRAATDAAHARGVIGVPTLAVGEELFWGDDRLVDAAAAHAVAG
ncbi:MAG TPA: DsbA family protein [Solirubrobacteraceae bacterium]|jgi:2-hydroxychromene-2-carboxylate isomerase|nr:DsbA family protein [Solirubrobacteraceae bacterium]